MVKILLQMNNQQIPSPCAYCRSSVSVTFRAPAQLSITPFIFVTLPFSHACSLVRKLQQITQKPSFALVCTRRRRADGAENKHSRTVLHPQRGSLRMQRQLKQMILPVVPAS